MMLEEKDEAVVWRGDKKHGLIKQFLRDVSWGELDYLVVDTPPGTSDEHLSVVKCLKSSMFQNGTQAKGGAIIVTTPQEMSLQDVRKEINFCRKVGMPVLGVVENMQGFVCPSCHGESDIFPTSSKASTRIMCEEMGLNFLGSVPLDPRVTLETVDPFPHFIDRYPQSKWADQFQQILKSIHNQLQQQ
jgi:Mrp family chromosome partitioning ATPase